MPDTPHAVRSQQGPEQTWIREFLRALFVPGFRYGWLARDLDSELRPYPVARPPDVSPYWRREHQILQEAVATDAAQLRLSRTKRQAARRRREDLAEHEKYLRETVPELQRTWERDRAAWDRAEQARVHSRPQHVPRGPGRTPRRTDIVGGDLFGWQCLLATVGSSFLAGGTRLEVLDLTERGAAALLTRLCELTELYAEGAVDNELVLLPEQADSIDLFEGLDRTGITSMLVESLGAANPDRTERLLHRRILDAAIHGLDPPITPARLTAALRLLLGHGGGAPEVAESIDDEEFQRLDAAFTPEQRGALLERVTVLEALLEPLARFGTSKDGVRPLFAGDRPGGFHCAALTGTDAEVVNELLVDLLVQAFIRRVSTDVASGWGFASSPAAAPGSAGTCVVVLGAERVSPHHLVKLDRLSIRHDFPLVLFFAALSEEIAETAIHNSDVLGIMRLTNHSQAERAASLIGPGERMELTQLALSESRAEAVNWGWSAGESSSGMPLSGPTVSEQRSGGGSRQDTTGSQRTYSKVRKLVVEPEFIQTLGSTAVALVDLVEGTKRKPISLDVDPRRALGP